MSIRKYKAEQIVTVLRQIEVQMANGKTAPQACKEAGIHTQTYYRWRKEYNTRRPHSALDYRPPAPGACNPFLLPEPISQPQAVM